MRTWFRTTAMVLVACGLAACASRSRAVDVVSDDAAVVDANIDDAVTKEPNEDANAIGDAALGDAEAADAAAIDDRPAVSTTRFLSMIYEHPRFESFHVGWFRAGSRVRVTEKVSAGPGVATCGKTWWKVDPVGYVCEGGKDGVTTDFSHPHVTAMAQFPAKRGQPLPYAYGMSNGAHLYGRIPTVKEQQAIEHDRDEHVKKWNADRAKTPEKYPLAMAPTAIPSFLLNGGPAPQLYAWAPQGKVLRAGYATMQTRLGLVTAFDAEERTFYLTTEGYVVAADRLKTHPGSQFVGTELGPSTPTGGTLPMFWVRYGNPASVWKIPPAEETASADGGPAKPAPRLAKPTDLKLPLRGRVHIAENPVNLPNGSFFEVLHPETAFGTNVEPGTTYLVRPSEGTRIDGAKEKPERVGDSEVWIEVHVGTQVLIVYEGLTPRYVTLVSTGAGKKHETPRGQFRVYQKHVSTKMSADEKPAEEEGEQPEKAYRYDDVGYTQFIFEGIALHTAFWHDGFGMPRSHGCINLSPRDAAWIFEKTLPRVPDGWHGMSAGRAGVPWGSMVWVKY